MARTPLSREKLLPLLAAHVLDQGLAAASLRPMAKAAGTSDRMLIYHFGSKERLVSAVLEHLAHVFTASLDTAFPAGRAVSRRACAHKVMEVTSAPEFAPFFRLWWDIVGGCARGEQSYLTAAQAIMDSMLGWVEDHLPGDDPDPAAGARIVLTMIEGAQVLQTIGRAEIGSAGFDKLDGSAG